jgi:hypothetical protein
MNFIENSLKNFKFVSFHGALSLISSIIAIFSIFFLSFHYDPLDFSAYGIFLSVATIILIFSKSDLDFAIISAQTNAQIIMYLNMIFTNCLIISIIIIFVSITLNLFNFSFYEKSNWSYLLNIFLIFYIFIVSFKQAMNSYFIKKKKFVLYFLAASLKQIFFLLSAYTNIIFELNYFNNYNLIFFLIISDLIVFIIFYNFFFRKISFKLKLPENFFNKMILLKPFYLFGSLTNLNLAFKEFIIIYIIQFKFGEVVLGQFMFFKKFFTGSIFLIKKVVGDIYISNINNLILKKKNIYSDFIFFLIFSTILSFSIYLFIIYFSEDLFQLYIDKKWFISQEILKIYSALICFSFVPSLLNRILNNYYQKIDFMWSLIFVFSILIFISYYNYNTYIDFFETLVKFEILIYALYLLITFTVIYKIQKKIEFNKLD